ncbi:unnamed protein product [Anisakis simplex]|uniref:Uncharacterized protein n=1 Tax=Anisakis simplex TaxID=6269 RepID=A0A0M3IZ65_ANISI|nr:unnamed protein product [Anisakis simplex]
MILNLENVRASGSPLRNTLCLVGWFVLICNLAILALIVYIDHGFVRFATNYSLISLLSLIAIICTIFALKDQNAAMLYPMLVSLDRVPLPLNLLLLGLAIEKTFEFVLFRRLMKMFEQQNYIDQFSQTINKATLNSANDTDDEIVVFEKVAKNGGQSAIYDYGTQRPSA